MRANCKLIFLHLVNCKYKFNFFYKTLINLLLTSDIEECTANLPTLALQLAKSTLCMRVGFKIQTVYESNKY